METILLIVSVLLIVIVLLQSAKAESASQALMGGNDLTVMRKERGSELIISRATMVLGTVFFLICLIESFM